MEYRELQAYSAELANNVERSVDNWDRFRKIKPTDSWRFVSALAHALGGKAPEYITGAISADDHIEIAVYGERHMAYYDGPLGGNGPRLQLIPRSAISNLEIISAPVVVSAPGFNDTGVGLYGAAYGDLAFNLPIASGGYRATEAFFPSLVADLCK